MNKDDLQKLIDVRVNEAKILLDNQYYQGAYYLLGYAVECTLKAMIVKQVKQHDFPDKKLAIDSHSHKFGELAIVAGIHQEIIDRENRDIDFKNNWIIAKDWSEKARYEHDFEAAFVHNFFNAI